MKLEFERETYQILGTCSEVYKDKGCGFNEEDYKECLEIEFGDREIPYSSQTELDLFYKGRKLRKKYKPDFMCFDDIIVKIKAARKLADSDTYQVINYLKATGRKVGLLVNFNHFPKWNMKELLSNFHNLSVCSVDSYRWKKKINN